MAIIDVDPKTNVPNVTKDDIAFGAYAKLRRALKHYEEFDRCLVEFLKTDFYTLTPHAVPHVGSSMVRITIRPLPADIPLIIGDFVHNVRSALDILWNTMVKRLGGDETVPYFPICQKRSELEGMLRKTDKVVVPAIPEVAEIILNKLRLYVEGDPPGNCAVWYLNKLDRMDKHRLIITAVHITGFARITAALAGGNLSFFERVAVPQGTFNILTGLPLNVERIANTDPVIRVEFEEQPLKGDTVPESLRGMGHDVGVAVFDIAEAWRATGRS